MHPLSHSPPSRGMWVAPYRTVKCSHRHKCDRRGFTLAELMIVIVIMGLIAVASIPAIGRFLQSWRLSGETDQLAGFLRRARSTAVMKNRDVIFKFKMSDNTYFYFEDPDGDGVRDAQEYQSATHELPPGISFEGHTLSGPILIFGPRGNANEGGTITLQNRRDHTRMISVFGGTGNVSVN
jgi:prepilin-type N-terminal cleavage/methylation domain-containing protein